MNKQGQDIQTGFNLRAPQDIDVTKGYIEVDGVQRPYTSVQEVIDNNPIEFRAQGEFKVVQEEGSAQKLYWWDGGIEDEDLKEFSPSVPEADPFYTADKPNIVFRPETKFSADIICDIGDGDSFGKYKPGDIIPAAGKTAIEVIIAANFKIKHPDYISPYCSITTSPSTSNIEIGTILSITINGIFAQNDAGPLTATTVKRNGTAKGASLPYIDNGVAIVATAKSYQINFAYSDGPTKNNNVPEPDPIGKILAGSINTNTINYQGYYRQWYGPVVTVPVTSADVRALPTTRLTNAGNTFTLNTGNVQKTFVIIIPATQTIMSVVDQDALNLPVTSSYVQQAITVNDAGGNPTSYKMYIMTVATPYSANHRHFITVT